MPNLQRTHRLTVPSSVSSTIAAQSHKRLDGQPIVRDKPTKIALQEMPVHHGSRLEADEPLQIDEVDSIVAILAAEFPLLDEPLIRAIVSDHTPEQLYSKTEEIREDLALLQASVVPDPDASRYEARIEPEIRPESPLSASLAGNLNHVDREQQLGGHSPSEELISKPPQPPDTQHVDRVALEAPDQDIASAVEAGSSSSKSDIDSASGSDSEVMSRDMTQEEAFGPTEFLCEMFEHLPLEDVHDALRNHRIDAGGDLSLAIEDLLSLEAIKQLGRRSSHSTLNNKLPDRSPPREEESDWRNFFIKPDLAAAVPPLEEIQSDPLAGDTTFSDSGSMEGPHHDIGPRPNDRPVLPLNTQMYSRISHPSGSTPVDSDNESLEDLPGTPKVRRVKPITSSGRYASLASVSREGYNSFSSGDESAGSVKKRTNRSSRAIPLRDFERRLPAGGIIAPARAGEWGTLQSLATYLAELVSKQTADSSYFLTYFHSPEFPNGYSAVREALTKASSPLAGLRAEIAMVREIRAGIEQSAQARTPIEDITLCVGAAGDVSRSLDLLALLEEIKTWGGEKLDSLGWTPARNDGSGVAKSQSLSSRGQKDPLAGTQGRGQRPVQPELSVPKRKKKEEHPQNWRVVRKEKAKKPRSTHRLAEFIPGYAKSSFGPDAVLFDMDECRRRAVEERVKREAAVRQAGRHFRSGGMGGSRGKQVAAFYAGEARRYEAAARSWELRAAEELVKNQSKSDGTFSIDLHGLTLDEAKSVALDRTQAWHASQNFVPVPSKPFQIITGQGKHSVNHVGILGPGVANELERAGWHVDRGYNGRGYIVVRGVRG